MDFSALDSVGNIYNVSTQFYKVYNKDLIYIYIYIIIKYNVIFVLLMISF